MYKVYQVQVGDTIEKIAQRLKMSVQDLINLNSLSGEVTPGELLVIPNQDTIFETYVIQKGDNLYEISRKYNISVEDLMMINGLNKDDFIYPGEQILIPRSGANVYITKEDETIGNIANKLGVNTMDLINQNESLYLVPEQLIIYRM